MKISSAGKSDAEIFFNGNRINYNLVCLHSIKSFFVLCQRLSAVAEDKQIAFFNLDYVAVCCFNLSPITCIDAKLINISLKVTSTEVSNEIQAL